jgi:hypothetical protein
VQTDDEGNPTKYKSQARYRDHDGHVRPVSAYAKTKTAAKRALLTKVQDRSKTGQSGELTAMHKITHHPSSPPPEELDDITPRQQAPVRGCLTPSHGFLGPDRGSRPMRRRVFFPVWLTGIWR